MATNYVSEYRGYNIVKVDTGQRVFFHANGVPAAEFLESYPDAVAAVDAWIDRTECDHAQAYRQTRDGVVWCGYCGEDI